MKNLTFPLFSAIYASFLVSASAQLTLELSTNATYRQNVAGVAFSGGGLNIRLTDGSATYTGCSSSTYIAPNPLRVCPEGTSGYVIFGNPDVVGNTPGPYYAISSITPALFVEPRQAALCLLNAAPASTLPRPLGGFKDFGLGLYFNLHTTSIKQYSISSYFSTRQYTKDQRAKFVSDIVPGAYYFSFPRLGYPNLPIAIPAQVYPMPEGLAKINNQSQGFQYGKFGSWNSQGFLKISYLKPNTFTWTGLTTSGVIISDSLYLSLRVLSNPLDPTSATDLVDNSTDSPQSIFPGFQNGGDPRVLLTSPFVTSFTVPPIFAGGTRGVLELQLNRNLRTSGVAADYSNRIYQIPVIVVNSYADYQDVIFRGAGANTGILDDLDGDGYNNLNEWILGSNAAQKALIPQAPSPDLFVDPLTSASQYGFIINEKLGTDPAVNYTLQRSKDGGKTWSTFTSDTNWIVARYHLAAGQSPGAQIDPAKTWIQVKSRTGTQPPGTLTDIYRVKITLR